MCYHLLGTFKIYELSAREKESTKKEKISKKETNFLSYDKRMFNKKKVNSFRIIVTTKMAEIFELKILGKIVFFQSLVCPAATTLRYHNHKNFFFFGFQKIELKMNCILTS
jgi:hypothetical protein